MDKITFPIVVIDYIKNNNDIWIREDSIIKVIDSDTIEIFSHLNNISLNMCNQEDFAILKEFDGMIKYTKELKRRLNNIKF